MILRLSLRPAAFTTAMENVWSLNGSRSSMVVELVGFRVRGFVLGLAPLSGKTRISIPVMGVKPSPPVIQEREMLVSPTVVSMRLLTGSAGTVCV